MASINLTKAQLKAVVAEYDKYKGPWRRRFFGIFSSLPILRIKFQLWKLRKLGDNDRVPESSCNTIKKILAGKYSGRTQQVLRPLATALKETTHAFKEVPNQGSIKKIAAWEIDNTKSIFKGDYTEVKANVTGNSAVAIKELLPKYQQDEGMKKQFISEVTFFAKIKPHPNIVKFIGVLSGEHRYAFAMEYVPQTMLDFIPLGFESHSHLKLVDALIHKICYTLALAIKHLHDSGLVHYDIKPDNVLINKNFDAKLCDFGLSRTVTDPIPEVYAVDYCAPEIFRLKERIPAENSTATNSNPQELGAFVVSNDKYNVFYNNDPKLNKFATDIYSFITTLLHFITHQPPISTNINFTWTGLLLDRLIENTQPSIPIFRTPQPKLVGLFRDGLKGNSERLTAKQCVDILDPTKPEQEYSFSCYPV